MSLEQLKEFEGKGRKKLLCLEVNPPRGTDTKGVFDRLDGQLSGIDYLNVTDCALAKMKFAALPFGALLKQRYGIEALVNLSCRDRNLIALQSDLLAGWGLGVRSIVALTGDAVTIGDSPERKGVFEVNSIGLLHAVGTLNSGKDLAGNDLTGKPDYVCGVVVNPNAKNRNAELKRLQRKKDAGGRYALSQPVFGVDSSVEFFKDAKSVGMPLMLGLLPFKSARAAIAMNSIPGIRLPDDLISDISKMGDADLSEVSIEHCLKIADANFDFVRGFHVISGAAPKLALTLAARLAEFIKKRGAAD